MAINIGLGKLPWYGQIGAFVALAGAAAAAFFNFYVSPLQGEMTLQREQLAALKNDIAKGLAIARKLPEYQKEIADMEAKLKSLQAVLPEEKDFGELVRRVDSLARGSNLRVAKITPGAPVAKQGYTELPFTLELEGNYHNLAAFFERVSKFQRIVNIGNIKITPRDKPDPSMTIQAQCVAMTFVLLPAPPQAPGPVKPAAAN